VKGLTHRSRSCAGGQAIVDDPHVRIRVHRIPFSTNVERIALTCGYKGIAVDWVDHDPGDRSGIEALSGQALVPVAEIHGRVLSDSPLIMRELERLVPDPALWPAAPAARAELDTFVDWFNRVWKVAPNRLTDEPHAEPSLRAAWADELRGSRDRFEALLDGRAFLYGDALTAADVVAFPFLKYATLADPHDDAVFHRVLAEHLEPGGGYPRLREWIARCDRLPRA
jgi:glutathione S-transferase